MLLLAKLGALGIAVWFYYTANQTGEKAFQWAIIGLIGYALTWGLVYTTMSSLLPVNRMAEFWVHQVPALVAIGVSVLVRKKLMTMSAEK